ncbi:hypothetical protein BGZ65_012168 [Modicella reniformis]|uniref:Galactose oxidase n=1 Tax=Modicella reniformis TaxID=1440133 RepID=A0A9P6SQQ5_9FUNG|nr:hypothetical protein BGZ65_012168 [Modicella reniformis]
MPVYSSIDTRALIISGGVRYWGKSAGSDYFSPTPQTFVIDLSTSWNTTNPEIKELSSKEAPTAPLTSTLSVDGNDWLVIGSDHLAHNYNIATNTWTNSQWNTQGSDYNQTFTAEPVVAAATDPTTGTIYLPGGFKDGERGYGMTKTAIGARDIPVLIPMYAGSNSPLNTTRLATWNAALGSMIEYNEGTGELHSFNETNGRNGAWKKLKTSGLGPGALSAYGGSKMVMFGGLKDDKSLRDVRILDIATMNWTRGADVPPSDARDGMACAVSYDSLIVWGGVNSNTVQLQDVMPLVYNIMTDKWVNEYRAEPMPKPTPTLITSTDSDSLAALSGTTDDDMDGQ